MDLVELLKAVDAPIAVVLLFILSGIRRDVKALHKRLNRVEHKLFPDEDDSTPPHGPRALGAAAALLVGISLLAYTLTR